MRVLKLGDGLGVQLPQDLVERLKLQPGDEIQVTISKDKRLSRPGDPEWEEAVRQFNEIRWDVPADYKFNRDEANER